MRVCPRVEHHHTVAWSLCVRFPAAAVAAARLRSPRLCHPSFFPPFFSSPRYISSTHTYLYIQCVRSCARPMARWCECGVCTRHYTATTPRFFLFGMCVCVFILSFCVRVHNVSAYFFMRTRESTTGRAALVMVEVVDCHGVRVSSVCLVHK